ncbi:hypothetical protein LCGC14_2123240, partial [marine sediment metagenome]
MSVTIRIVVEDIADKLLIFDEIELHRSDTLGGSYAQVATESLVEDQFYYSIVDSGGDINKWYKYRFHQDVPLANSDYSDPFRVDGVTRLRARQAALSKYGAGLVMVADGGSTSVAQTADYRVKTALFRADRGKGTWLLPSTGGNQGAPRIVLSSDPGAGQFTVSPIWPAVIADGNE